MYNRNQTVSELYVRELGLNEIRDMIEHQKTGEVNGQTIRSAIVAVALAPSWLHHGRTTSLGFCTFMLYANASICMYTQL